MSDVNFHFQGCLRLLEVQTEILLCCPLFDGSHFVFFQSLQLLRQNKENIKLNTKQSKNKMYPNNKQMVRKTKCAPQRSKVKQYYSITQTLLSAGLSTDSLNPENIWDQAWCHFCLVHRRAHMCLSHVWAVSVFLQLMAVGVHGHLGQPAQQRAEVGWRAANESVTALLHSTGAGSVWEIPSTMKSATNKSVLSVSVHHGTLLL